MGFFDKFLDAIKLNDEYDDELFDDEFDDDYAPKKAKPKKAASPSKLVSINSRNNNRSSSQVFVIKPQEFNEAQIVADFLKEGKTIVVNLEGIEISQAQRIIDFIGGASFAVDGSLKAISNNIFIVAPGNIEVSGDLRDEIISDSMLSPELTKF